MTPAARLEAAIELLDAIAAAARDEGAAADTLIARYFTTRRYAGSKDRRAVRELAYDVIRAIGDRPESGRAAMIGYARAHAPELLPLFGEGPHAPAALMDGEPEAKPSLAPAWLTAKLRPLFGKKTNAELAALLGRAPLDLRVNLLKATPEILPRRGRGTAEGGGGVVSAGIPLHHASHGPPPPAGEDLRTAVAALLPPTEPTPRSPLGLRALEPFNVETHPAFLEGLIEVQDEGSQLACLTCEAAPGMTVVDLCAGAGGKTLALAAAMANAGRVVASDTDRGRLSRLAPRAERAGATIIETRLLDPAREADALADLARAADLVLVDAPCSGTGTWRRNPEARWRLNPKRLERLTKLQSRLLDIAAALVKPGGALTYVVCSLLPGEGPAQVDAFLARTPGWARARGDLTLTPHRDGTDGFFIARLSPMS